MATNKNFIVKNGLEVGGVEVINASGNLTNVAFPSELTPTFSNLTLSENLNFADNGKAIFGVGSDLQIYHDGYNSIIAESGAGSLLIRGDNTYFTNSAATKSYADFIADGAVILRNNNLQKLATTATGIDVTGTVTADGLNVDNGASKPTATIVTTGIGGGDTPTLIFHRNSDSLGDNVQVGVHLWQTGTAENSVAGIFVDHVGTSENAARMEFYTAESGNFRQRMRIAENGDLSLYEDTGTTPKFFWDASAESLGIRNVSPDQSLDIGVGGLQIKGNIAAPASGTSAMQVDYSSGGARYWSRGATIGVRGTHKFFTLTNTGGSQITPLIIETTGGVTLNEDSADADFRVESDSNSHMLFVDGGEDIVSMGMPAGVPSWIGGNSVVVADNIYAFQAASYSNACFNLSVDNNFTYLLHNAYYGAGWKQRLTGYSPTMLQTGSAAYNFNYAADTGSDASISWIGLMALNSSGAIFNDGGNAGQDFRVESDANANMLRVDAGSNRVVIGSSAVAASSPLAAFQVGGNFTISNFDLNSNTVTDTGISINQGNAGMAMQVLASNHGNVGTNTKAGQYFLKFYFSGNNAPAVTLVAGDNCVTFGVSASNTLTVQMPAGGNSISFFTSG